MVLEGGVIMTKFRVELELDYDGIVSSNPPPRSKSHINAIMRDDVLAQVQDALTLYGFKADVYQVRKVNA
jgi:hypothetical protein